MSYIYLRCIVAMMLFGMVAGCNSSIKTSARIISSSAAITKIPTRTPTPTLPRKTATATPTETWKPVPTLDSKAALARIKELYVNMELCEIPCWWGITPGKTTWTQARQILSEIQPEQGPYYREIVTRYKYSFEVPANFDVLDLGFIEASIFVSGDIVVAISTNTGWIHRDFNYSRTSLLTLLGKPDEIWLRHTTPESELLIEYEMDLLYKSKGVLLNISGVAKKEIDTLLICPQNFQRGAFPAAITMYASEVTNSFDQLRELLFGKYELTETRYVRLGTITDGFGESEFYELYKKENAIECFSVQVK